MRKPPSLASIELPRNIGVLLLAAMLSVAVWVLANAEQNPEVTAVFSSPIPVEVIGPAQGHGHLRPGSRIGEREGPGAAG